MSERKTIGKEIGIQLKDYAEDVNGSMTQMIAAFETGQNDANLLMFREMLEIRFKSFVQGVTLGMNVIPKD